jgi:CRP-like cAMP-binding protein
MTDDTVNNPTESVREQLRKHIFLPELPDTMRVDMVDVLLTHAQPVNFEAGHTLYSSGEHSDDQAYIILEGTMEISSESAQSLMLNAPTLIGEMAHVTPLGTRLCTVVAHTDLTALQFSWKDCFSAVQEKGGKKACQQLELALQKLVWSRLIPLETGQLDQP